MMTIYKLDELCTSRGKKVAEKKVAANTVLRRLDDGSIAVRYVDTDVLTFHKDLTVTIRAGGWYTQTTMRRIEQYLDGAPGVRIFNHGADGWRVTIMDNSYTPTGQSYPFQEGMRLTCLGGALVDAGTPWGEFQEYNKLANKWIDKLVKQIDAVNIHPDMREQYENCMDGDVIKGVLTLELIEDCYRIYWNGTRNGFGQPMWTVRWQYEVLPLLQGGRRGYHDIPSIKATVRSALRMRYLRGPLGIRKNMGVPRPLPPTYAKVAQPE